MTDEKIARINALAKKAKTEGLMLHINLFLLK